jgi:hypothetical protein
MLDVRFDSGGERSFRETDDPDRRPVDGRRPRLQADGEPDLVRHGLSSLSVHQQGSCARSGSGHAGTSANLDSPSSARDSPAHRALFDLRNAMNLE